MSLICLYRAVDVDDAVWEGPRRPGIPAFSVAEERRLGLDGGRLLQWTNSQDRVLLTRNVRDSPRIHGEVLDRTAPHSNVIVASRNLSVGEVIRRAARGVRDVVRRGNGGPAGVSRKLAVPSP